MQFKLKLNTDTVYQRTLRLFSEKTHSLAQMRMGRRRTEQGGGGRGCGGEGGRGMRRSLQIDNFRI